MKVTYIPVEYIENEEPVIVWHGEHWGFTLNDEIAEHEIDNEDNDSE